MQAKSDFDKKLKTSCYSSRENNSKYILDKKK